jgi:hypothetical protein
MPTIALGVVIAVTSLAAVIVLSFAFILYRRAKARWSQSRIAPSGLYAYQLATHIDRASNLSPRGLDT